MKIYLSYGMTNCLEADRQLRKKVRAWLERWKESVEFYDPEKDEPGGQTLAFLQDFEYEQMRQCDGMLVIWGPGTLVSNGVAAEIEWARRIFGVPVVIYNPTPETVRVPEWAQTTAQQRECHDLPEAWGRLMQAIAEVAMMRATWLRNSRR
jgi:hypothetical protein